MENDEFEFKIVEHDRIVPVSDYKTLLEQLREKDQSVTLEIFGNSSSCSLIAINETADFFHYANLRISEWNFSILETVKQNTLLAVVHTQSVHS